MAFESFFVTSFPWSHLGEETFLQRQAKEQGPSVVGARREMARDSKKNQPNTVLQRENLWHLDYLRN